MKVGIVGHEAKKFTPETRAMARQEIRSIIKEWQATLVISGRSPLGGIDIWAIEEANGMGVATREHLPGVFQWDSVKGVDGFKARNLKIARDSDLVVCIVVQRLPAGYTGMEVANGCYHCHTPPDHHVKSGGCWTMKEAGKMGKKTVLVVLHEEVRAEAAIEVRAWPQD